MSSCLVCQSPSLAGLLDCGEQPLCNRFLHAPDHPEAVFPIALGVCRACGLVQLLAPPSPDEVKPRVDWLTCNEPESHLDELAEDLARLPGVELMKSAVYGVSFKDDSLLQRLSTLGFTHVKRLDPITDLDIRDSCAGIETVSTELTPERAKAFVERHGPATVVVARHIFEHAADPRRFASALASLLAPGGYLVVEIPDCEKALAVCDYTTVWEEHSLYFTPYTFRRGMECLGFTIEKEYCIPYMIENSLIAVMRFAGQPVAPPAANDDTRAELERAERFASSFAERRKEIATHLEAFQREVGKIAIFGAGHMACTFVNLFKVGYLVDCFIDDNPHKVGLYMPGSRLRILSSRALIDRDIQLCLLSINVAGERTVIDKNGDFVARGGKFRSIFPASPLAIVR